MSNTQITPMPESHARVAYKSETGTDSSTYGVFTDPASGGTILRCIEPKWGEKSNPVNYNESWASRVSEKRHRFQKYKTFDTKHYFYIPSTANEVTALIAYYKLLLLPAHMTAADADSDCVFTIDDTFVDTAATPGCIKRHGNSIVFQEYTEGRKMAGARNNFKLAFATNAGMTIECNWQGLPVGDGLPYDASAGLFAKPAHAGQILDFASAGFFICTAAEAATTVPTTTYYLICKSFEFDFGNRISLLDDCNGANALNGMHIGNVLGEQKVSFDVARPLTHGAKDSAISATSFPWLQYYLDGAPMYWQMTLLGTGTFANGAGIRLEGVFQIEDEPESTPTDGLRRIKIGGNSRSETIGAATLNGFRMTVFNNIT